MVRFVVTPWRHAQELLDVRRDFYPAQTSADDAEATSKTTTSPSLAARQQRAVARVEMWARRGNCPHMVESTALLTAARLLDARLRAGQQQGDDEAATMPGFALRTAYSMAFSRFVTGLLDGQQARQRKMSMYALAKTVRLPARFVELRHETAHEELPGLGKLRRASREALEWIWDYYWRNLPEVVPAASPGGEDACRAALGVWLSGDGDGQEELARALRRWGQGRVLGTLADLGEEAGEDFGLKLRTVRASREVIRLARGEDNELESAEDGPRDVEGLREQLERTKQKVRDALDQRMAVENDEAMMTDDLGEGSAATDGRWTRYPGKWTPKPIGRV